MHTLRLGQLESWEYELVRDYLSPLTLLATDAETAERVTKRAVSDHAYIYDDTKRSELVAVIDDIVEALEPLCHVTHWDIENALFDLAQHKEALAGERMMQRKFLVELRTSIVGAPVDSLAQTGNR